MRRLIVADLAALCYANRVTGEERLDMGKRIRDVAQAQDGAVLLLVDGDDGELLRLTPTSTATRQ